MHEAISQFRDAMRANGLEPPSVIVPGKYHRFPGVGKPPGNTAGWCLLFEDGLGGVFGDWSSGLSECWHIEWERPLTDRERESLRQHTDERRRKSKADRTCKREKAARTATSILNAAPAAPGDHPYLTRKHVSAHGVRIHRGSLVLPVMTFTGEISSLQFIDREGGKRLLSGGRKRGCYIPVAGEIYGTPSKVIICEGWATGCTLAAAEPDAVVLAAIDAGNLERVAVSARRRWPSAEIVVAGDDDRLTQGNPGATFARAAAKAAGAELRLPPWPADAPEDLTDFNDLAIWLEGRSA